MSGYRIGSMVPIFSDHLKPLEPNIEPRVKLTQNSQPRGCRFSLMYLQPLTFEHTVAIQGCIISIIMWVETFGVVKH